jgi:octaprenyl-diphosphate synthase
MDSSARQALALLKAVSHEAGLDELRREMARSSELLAGVAKQVDPEESPAAGAASLLLERGGKRLRPACVALAARCGRADVRTVRGLATAVELIHTATLLQDDVIDDAPTRRGGPAPRVLYGNAVAVFAGDLLMVKALEQVLAVSPTLLASLLATMETIVHAESRQLAQRGRCDLSLDDYLSIIDGKTAALFAWATFAGGIAANLSNDDADALREFGRSLGVAFQVADDLLDYVGDPASTGKELFADLREGKATYPLCVALDREPTLRERLSAALASDTCDDELRRDVLLAMKRTGALEQASALVADETARGRARLATLPSSVGRDTLDKLAVALVSRKA